VQRFRRKIGDDPKMKSPKKSICKLTMITVFFVVGLLFPGTIFAGDLEPVAGPDNPGSAMYTLEDIYNRLNDNTTATKRTGEFAEPWSLPDSTGFTLDQIYEIAIPTRVEKTGQKTCFDANGVSISCIGTRQDGDLQKGVDWPSQRFTDNGDGTVSDNLTDLIWLKNANCFGTVNWITAISTCNSMSNGSCGLSDGSSAGDWRLPNIKELLSLIDFANYNPALPSGHPFIGVQSHDYWSSSNYIAITSQAWPVDFYDGDMTSHAGKDAINYVWPVRNGH